LQNICESAANKQSALAWISVRKSTCKSKLKAASQAERLIKWQAHFQKLLTYLILVKVSDNEIEKKYPLNIKLGNFTPDELDIVLNILNIPKIKKSTVRRQIRCQSQKSSSMSSLHQFF